MDSLVVTSALVLHYYASRKRVQCGLAQLNRGTGQTLETGIRTEGGRVSVSSCGCGMNPDITRFTLSFLSARPHILVIVDALPAPWIPQEESRAMTRFLERGQTTPVTWNLSYFYLTYLYLHGEDSYFFRERKWESAAWVRLLFLLFFVIVSNESTTTRLALLFMNR